MATKSEKLWSFTVDRIEYTPGEQSTNFFTVWGKFIYAEIRVEQDPDNDGSIDGPEEPQLVWHALNEDPVKLNIPSYFIQKESFSVAPADVVPILNNLFQTTDFKPIPRPPETFPMHRVPPSRREAAARALRDGDTV